MCPTEQPLRGILFSLTIFFVTVLLLVTPSYQITTIGQVSTTSYQDRTILTTPNPITLQQATPASSAGAYWVSNDFFLQQGSTVKMAANCAPATCLAVIWQDWGNQKTINFTINGTPNVKSGSLIVPQSGNYKTTILNMGNAPVTLSVISIVEQIPHPT
ncbi:MAG TPA: hypothetical protein VE862_04160 [Candidatus Acidoferrum sp.]|nr:hypothetical protein [Candidatus Acidoferrum sp.]